MWMIHRPFKSNLTQLLTKQILELPKSTLFVESISIKI